MNKTHVKRLDEMNHIDKQQLENTYLNKTIRIKCLSGEDDHYAGKEGKVISIDDMGQLHGTWGGLAVIPEVDDFEIITSIDLKESVKFDISKYSYSDFEELVRSKGRKLNNGIILLKCSFVPAWDTFPECRFNGLCLKDNKLCFQLTGGGWQYNNDWWSYEPFTLDKISFRYPDHNGRRISMTYDNEDIANFLTKLLEEYK